MINKLHYLFLFVLIFSFFASVRAFDYHLEYEEDTDKLEFFDYDGYMNNGFTYPNGTALMQFIHRFDNVSYENNLYIRLLHPNGTLTKFTVSTYNSTKYEPHAFPLNDGYVLVTQLNDDTIMHGMLVDWNGQVLQK